MSGRERREGCACSTATLPTPSHPPPSQTSPVPHPLARSTHPGLASAGRMEEWQIHFRVALNVTKVPLLQLREMILDIQLYCGAPIARDCMAIARKVFKELNIDQSVLDDDETA